MHWKGTRDKACCAATCTHGHHSGAEVPTLRYQGCWAQGTRSSRFRQKLNSILSHQKEVVSMSQYCRSGTPSLGRATVCRAGRGVSRGAVAPSSGRADNLILGTEEQAKGSAVGWQAAAWPQLESVLELKGCRAGREVSMATAVKPQLRRWGG